MPGFIACVGTSKNFIYDIPANPAQHIICTQETGPSQSIIERRVVNKFTGDKIFDVSRDNVMVIDGVVLNKQELCNRYHGTDWLEVVHSMRHDQPTNFFGNFQGSFSGITYDKRTGIWTAFTNHIGDKQLFYTVTARGIIVSSELSWIISLLRCNQIEYTLNKQAAYQTLTYGYFLQDNTLVSEIKKLRAGCFINIHHGELDLHRYWRPKNGTVKTITQDQAIEELDRRFRTSIKRCYEKDREYDFRHLVALSGGMDSRLNAWVAHEMGYEDQLNLCFSQSGYLDETVSKKIARDLKHEYLFKSLDNGLCLLDPDPVSQITSGGILFYGLAHGMSCLDLINYDSFGCFHTGQLGDVVVGSYVHSEHHTNASAFAGAFSTHLKHRLAPLNTDEYENLEQFMMMERGFNGILQGNLGGQQWTEVVSPFLDIDFFDFCFSLPLSIRINRKLYIKWYLTKYPTAASYKWSNTEAALNASKQTKKLMKMKRKFINKLKKIESAIKGDQYANSWNMNPTDFWYRSNPMLNTKWNNYLDTYLDIIEDPLIRNDCVALYREGKTSEKTQVLTLISAVKHLWK